MSNEKDWYSSLDDLILKLNSGDFIDQSLNEFKKTVNTTVSSQGSSTQTKKTSGIYKEVLPRINRTVESTNYGSRYKQITACLEKIEYGNYNSEKQNGYKQCISAYLNELYNSTDLKTLESRINSEMSEYKKKVGSQQLDNFLIGYYDALLMVKKVFYNSKLARMQELSSKVELYG